jgi:hypothetical protein
MNSLATKRRKKAQKNYAACHPEHSEGSSMVIAGVRAAGFFTPFRMTGSGVISVSSVSSVCSVGKNLP